MAYGLKAFSCHPVKHIFADTLCLTSFATFKHIFVYRSHYYCSSRCSGYTYLLKGISVIDHSKLHFFPNLPIFFFFCIFRENSTVLTFTYTTTLSEMAYFWEQRPFFVVENLLSLVMPAIINSSLCF